MDILLKIVLAKADDCLVLALAAYRKNERKLRSGSVSWNRRETYKLEKFYFV